MKLVPLKSEDFDYAQSLYDEGLEWAPRSVIYDVGLWQKALSSQSALWKMIEVDGYVKGLAGLENIHLIDRVCEPYIAIDRDLRGTGFALTAGELMRKFAVEQLGIQRIQSIVLENSPSRKLLDRLGFIQEGLMRKARYKNGEFVNAIMYAWLRS